MRSRLASALVVVGLGLTQAACCDLAIKTNELPDGKVGQQYNFEFSADCDNDKWEFLSGDMPPGLSLNQGGELTGVPTQAGVYGMTVGVSGQGDSGDFVSKGFSLTVIQPVGTLEITTSSSGGAVDPDGYSVIVGTNQYSIGINDTLTLPDVPVGQVSVALGGLEAGCSVSVNPVVATIAEGMVTTVTFEVVCNP